MELRSLVVLVVLWAIDVDTAAVDVAPASPTSKYTTRYDYIDVDAILKSTRLLKSYMDCVLERGACTREGLELKKNIPDAIQTECSKCSETQKKWAGKIMAHLQQNNKKYWKDILTKYDPDESFRRKYELEDDDEDEE